MLNCNLDTCNFTVTGEEHLFKIPFMTVKYNKQVSNLSVPSLKHQFFLLIAIQFF